MIPWYCVQRKWLNDQESINCTLRSAWRSLVLPITRKIGAGCKQELKGHFANRTLSITYLTPTYSSHCHAREQSNYLNSPKTDTSKWKKKTLSVFKEKCRRPQWATPFWSWLLQSHSGFSVAHSGDLYVSLSDYCYFIHLTSGDVMDCHLFAGKALRSTSKQNKGRFMPERIQCTKDAQPVEIKGEPCFPLTDLSTQRLSKQRCKMKILIQKINERLSWHNTNIYFLTAWWCCVWSAWKRSFYDLDASLVSLQRQTFRGPEHWQAEASFGLICNDTLE